MFLIFKNLNVVESVILRVIYYNWVNIKLLFGGGNRGGCFIIVYLVG